MIATCVCGQTFTTKPCLVAAGKGKFCSKKCAYANKTRRSGLKYNIVKQNTGWFKKGQLPPFAGKQMPRDAIERMRQKKIGLRVSTATEFKPGQKPWNFGKAYPAIRGPNHHNWKGGVTEENLKIRGSIEYKNWRRAVFERDDYTCQFCHKRGGNLEADHIKPFSQFPELRLDINNGRTLCEGCHRKTDTYGPIRKR